MIVLSLFDGISCGQVALQRANVPYEKYYASEIDKYAIKITQKHYPNTIQLGDITQWRTWNIEQPDLIIGGSPCQGFSNAGKRLNFDDPRSKLFFEFVNIINFYKPRWFLLENVKMKSEWRDIISSYMGVQPKLINSSLFSKQNRPRLYWTNIQYNDKLLSTSPNFDGWLYRLGHGYIRDEIKFFSKYPSLTAQYPSTKYKIIDNIDNARNTTYNALRKDNNIARSATPEEYEEFQTLPIGYTNIINKTNRYKVIGNCWTVNVIAHIFKGLQQ